MAVNLTWDQLKKTEKSIGKKFEEHPLEPAAENKAERSIGLSAL